VLRVLRTICVCVVCALAGSSIVGASELKGNSNPRKLTEMDAAGLNVDLSVDMHALNGFTDTVTSILREQKFAELDCLADQARSGKERLAGGLWKLHVIYAGLREPVPHRVHATQADWTGHLQRLQSWVKLRPESITARVALALAYLDLPIQ
jgi:hypothetical protein